MTAAANGAVRVVRVVRLLSDSKGAEISQDFDVAGQLDVALLSETLPFNNYDSYLCGPAAFMQSLYNELRKLNIADNRIHAEAFGPAGSHRETEARGDSGHIPLLADRPTPVAVVKSGKEARWNPGSGSLLDLAESRGLAPGFGCRGGSCGTCSARIMEGVVAYPVTSEVRVANGEALIRCAVPTRAEEGRGDHLLLDL